MNSVVIAPMANSVGVSLFDVYTTTYFLTAASMLEKHKKAKMEEEEEEEEAGELNGL